MADIEKGKKRRRRTATVHFYENMNKPARGRSETLAELHRDEAEAVAEPDETKATGNPVPPPPGSRPVTDRVSPPLIAGHAAPSTGDHGAAFADPMNQPGPRALAYGHENMRQGTTSPLPLLSFRSNADSFPRDLRGGAGVPVALSRLDAAGAAGMPPFRADPSGNPAVRPLDRIAQNSATSANGSHVLSNPVSHAAPMAAKTASEARAILKRAMFGGNGAR